MTIGVAICVHDPLPLIDLSTSNPVSSVAKSVQARATLGPDCRTAVRLAGAFGTAAGTLTVAGVLRTHADGMFPATALRRYP